MKNWLGYDPKEDTWVFMIMDSTMEETQKTYETIKKYRFEIDPILYMTNNPKKILFYRKHYVLDDFYLLKEMSKETVFELTKAAKNKMEITKEKIMKLNFLYDSKDCNNTFQSNLNYPLFKYQEVILEYFETENTLGLFDDMGLGKTIQCISVMDSYYLLPCLIIAPKLLVYNWKSKIEEYCKRKYSIQVIEKMEDFNIPQNKDITIVNYSLIGMLKLHSDKYNYFKEFNNFIKNYVFSLMICDEAHYLKHEFSDRTDCIYSISKKIPHIILSTGTPFTNNVLDMIGIFKILRKINKVFLSKEEYLAKYAYPIKLKKKDKRGKPIIVYKTNKKMLPDLYEKIKHFCLRRMKKDVLDLKEKIYSNIFMEIENIKEYQKAEEEFKKYIYEKTIALGIESHGDEQLAKEEAVEKLMRVERAETLIQIGTLRELTGIGKLEFTKELIEMNEEKGIKAVYFIHHKKVQNQLREWFPKALHIFAEDSQKEREETVNQFKDDSHLTILCSLGAGAIGLDLQSASTAYMIELPWGFDNTEQAFDRIYRIGQKKEVECNYILSNTWIDEYMMEIIKNKKEMSQTVLGDKK